MKIRFVVGKIRTYLTDNQKKFNPFSH